MNTWGYFGYYGSTKENNLTEEKIFLENKFGYRIMTIRTFSVDVPIWKFNTSVM